LLFKYKTILITGGSGFIGLHLSRYLKKEYDVTAYDIKDPGDNDIEFILGDVNDKEKLLQACQGIDVVIHLAAVVGVKNTEDDPVTTLNTNIIGTKNILEACAKNNVKKVILASSSEVYGEPKILPIDESHIPMPVTSYGISKLASEEYVKSYAKMHNFKYSILRFFNVIGQGQALDFVFPEFINSALKNEHITIHGSGLQIRAFCHVDDICQGVKKVIPTGHNEIFNIGNDSEPISIENLAKKIITVLNSQSNIRHISFEKSDRNRNIEIMSRVPNIQKAKKLLAFEPKIDLENAIQNIAKQF